MAKERLKVGCIGAGTIFFRHAAGWAESDNRLVEHPSAASVFQSLGEHGILARHFPDQLNRLRLGLPPDDAALALLGQALAASRAAVS